MLDRWLTEQGQGETSGILHVRHLTTNHEIDPQAAQDWLGHELLRNYVPTDELNVLETVFRDLALPGLADHLIKHKFPSDPKVRSGDFGEALSGALFRRVRRWCVPILKLRYKHRPDQPVQGADFLAFRLRQVPPVVASPEVKTRLDKRLEVGLQAAKSLQGVMDDLPSSITFVAARLSDRGLALGSRIGQLLVSEFRVERHIVLVQDERHWDRRVVERLEPELTEQTEVTVIVLPELRELIGDAYASAATAPARSAARRREGTDHQTFDADHDRRRPEPEVVDA
ncbi:hypothetical protein [Streptosporangium amethystogenes]|uniref:hypothetical protein n=1 Tax=Streptosporangium amethystogenes TaxID=2002 RepID=UPI0004C8497B|nr:hypothetical protein [Streptosporangium amethystogenes]